MPMPVRCDQGRQPVRVQAAYLVRFGGIVARELAPGPQDAQTEKEGLALACPYFLIPVRSMCTFSECATGSGDPSPVTRDVGIVNRTMAHITTPAATAAAANARTPVRRLPRYATIPPAINAAPSIASTIQTTTLESMSHLLSST